MEVGQQPDRPHQRGDEGWRPDRVGGRRSQGPGPQHRQRGRVRNDRQAAIVDLPLSGRNVWSLASTTPGVLGGLNSDIGLSFRGAGQREIQNSLSLDGINSSSNLLAATSMRPIADAVEASSGPDRQHLGRVRLVSRRPHQRRDQERHQRAARLPDALLPGRSARLARLLREPRRCLRIRGGRNQFCVQMDGPVVHPQALRRPQQDVLHGRLTKDCAAMPSPARSTRCRPR